MKLALALMLMVSGHFAFSATKIGIVDMQKAIEATKAGMQAKKELENDFGKRKKDLEKKEAELRKRGQEFQKKAAALSEAVRTRKQKELQGEMQEFQQSVSKNQIDIQQRQNELLKPIIERLRTIIGGIAQKESYTAILEKSDQIVLYATPDMDLTDRIVKEFDSSK